MNVLLIGSGGREHALAWKLSQSPRLSRLFAAPGNPGIANHAESVSIDPADHGSVIEFCRREAIGLVVIGPEAPLVAGLADDLREAGIAVFGPGRVAAQLEGSKGFTKRLCEEAGIATARFASADDRHSAEAALAGFDLPVVIKADGLAAGKGVVIAADRDEARAALARMFDGAFGEAGQSVIIEEYMEGEEVSFFALVDGTEMMPFGSAQDHKRVGEGETGPNTGGMGAYSPATIFTDRLQAQVMEEMIRPTLESLARAGTPYSGILYAGLMLTADGPRLVEYNARFGDPECQVLMLRLQSDLLELMLAAATGRLGEMDSALFSDDVALTVVMASKNYPGAIETGGEIGNLDGAAEAGAIIFQAGTARLGDRLVANGGRVLNVTAKGADIEAARRRAYEAIALIDFPDGFCRGDIGWRELRRSAADDAPHLL